MGRRCPLRVVSLTCSNTELLWALGATDLLVGVDSHSDFPPAALAGLPRVGKDLDVDADAVAALRPDLVLGSLTVPGHEKVIARLAEKRLNLLVTAPTSGAHVARDLRWLGGLLGRAAAGEAAAQALEAALQPDPAAAGGPRVLIEWWPRPCIAAGAESWVNEVLAAAGCQNAALDAIPESSRAVSVDEVLAMGAEVLALSWCGVPDHKVDPAKALRRAGWGAVPAVRDGRVGAISEAFLGRPGPRLAEGVRQLRALAYGDR
jgi:iron complex transport system substrate-binding protein